jgi:hypothetical protein
MITHFTCFLLIIGATLGGMIVGYAFRGREHAMIADVVKTAMTEWHTAQNKVGSFATGIGKKL